MTISFSCPHCGVHTDVDEKYAGSSGPCFQCGQTVTVPAASGAAASMDPYAAGPPPARKKSNTWVWAIVAVGGLAVVCCVPGMLALLLPAVQAARQAAWKAQCTNNLKQIGVALHAYHADYGTFPPAVLPDANGNPAHSWRVLLLPYLEQQHLYARYDFDEPWDGPNNKLLAAEMPEIYRCAAGAAAASENTSYMAVVGPGFFFDPQRAVAMTDIRDGLSNTIAVVESDGSSAAGVPWMAPYDLDSLSLNFTINGVPVPAISSHHRNGANVLMADGAVYFLNDQTSPADVQAMLTVEGGEVVNPPWEMNQVPRLRP